MNPQGRQGLYEMQYRTDGTLLPTCCVECLNHEENVHSRIRRRCNSEGLERSPYDVWSQNNQRTHLLTPYHPYEECGASCKIVNCSRYSNYVKSPFKIRETQIINNHQNGTSDKLIQCNMCNIKFCGHDNAKCNDKFIQRETHIGRQDYCDRDIVYSKNSISPNSYIENKEPPRRNAVGDSNTVIIVEPRPRTTESKMPLKSILVHKSRRSVSPSYFRKTTNTKGKTFSEWTDNSAKYNNTCDVKRRVRARSESEKSMCLVSNDSCKYGSCCWSMLKRPRGRSPPPLAIHHSRSAKEVYDDNGYSYQESSTRNSKKLEPCIQRDVEMSEWSVYDGVVKSPSGKLIQSKSKSIGKNKKSSSKAKSRLHVRTTKKVSIESSSTGSDFSDDELSDGEDGESKASINNDSDVSVEAVDNQECLTSDSGPSVTSTSDTASLNGLTSALSVGSSNLSDEEILQSMIRPSLFAHVPPYLCFFPHDSTPIRVPVCIQRHLRWKVTTITPVVVRKTLLASGFRLIRSECTQGGKHAADTTQIHDSTEWIGTWGKHMKSLCFKTLKDSQKMNHFPGTFQIGRKDRLWRNLQKLMYKYGQKEFGLMPKTYVLPHDLKALKHDWEKYAAQNEKWIIKPPASARGTGIKVVSRWTQVPKRRPVVVQRYISRPLLIDGSKFDMRLYVLVTSIHPLRVYLYPDGLARFASVKYSDDNSSLHDRYMHLTNYSINRLSKSYTHNQDAEACQGHKWTLQALLTYLKNERGIDTEKLWNNMKDLVIKTILSGESSISCLTKSNIGSHFNCYELFGIDVLLDENLKPWLLEVNISPSLHSASPLDLHVKGPLVCSLFNMVQFHVPEKVSLEGINTDQGPILHDKRIYTVELTKEEKQKQSYFIELENRSDYLNDILTDLTPDDVRHLILAEDELTQKNNLERIFPTADTHHYLNFFAGPRYYNRLFDAWETMYGDNRKAGIKRLQELCERGVHLEVPPSSAKSDEEEPKEDCPSSSLLNKIPPPIIPPDILPLEVMDTTVPSTSGSVVPQLCSIECHHILGEMCLICRPNIKLQETQPLPVQQHA